MCSICFELIRSWDAVYRSWSNGCAGAPSQGYRIGLGPSTRLTSGIFPCLATTVVFRFVMFACNVTCAVEVIGARIARSTWTCSSSVYRPLSTRAVVSGTPFALGPVVLESGIHILVVDDGFASAESLAEL